MSELKVVFNSVHRYSEDACGAQALKMNVEIGKLLPVSMRILALRQMRGLAA
jgi:hypothetical protein